MRSTPLLGAAAALSLLLGSTACAADDEDTEKEIKEQISAAFQEGDEGLDEEAADCFAQIVIDDVGLEELRGVDLSAETPEGLAEPIATATQRASDECEID